MWLRAFLLLNLAATVSAQAQPGTWTVTNSLTTARHSHTATILADGRVLVVGGIGANGQSTDSAEIFDPVAGQWTSTGKLSSARASHTATLLFNGRILVAGGQSGGTFLNSCELYNPATGTWRPTGSLQVARSNHTATGLFNGRILVAGGTDSGFADTLQAAELYNPSQETWTPVADMEDGRASHTATNVSDGRVMVAGGIAGIVTGQFARLTSAEIYSPAEASWTPAAAMSERRVGHTATRLADGSVLVAGGDSSDAELYDSAIDEWLPAGRLFTARAGHTATLLDDGRVLVAGGISSVSLSSAEIYDPSLAAWMTTGQLNVPRHSHTATLLADGRVLVAGGQNLGPSLASAELLTPPAPGSPEFILYPQLALGGGFTVVLFLTNQSLQAWSGKGVLAGGEWPSARRWSLNGEDQTGHSDFDIVLGPNQTRKFVLSSPAGAFAGWLEIVGVSGSQVEDLAGAFFYNFFSNGELVASTGVAPAEPAFALRFPVERTPDLNTGVAIRRAPTLTFTLYGQDGGFIETVTTRLNGSRFFDQIFSNVPESFVGSVRIQSGVAFYLTVLRQDFLPGPELRFQLTSIPATPVP